MKYVIGYASLLSPVSIRRLFPSVGKITPVKIPGHARCFNSYGTLSIKKGLVQKGEKEVASAAAILRPGSMIYALAFQLGKKDFETYQRHEFRYDLQEIEVFSRDTGKPLKAIICYEGADHLIDTSLVGVADIYALYAQHEVQSFCQTFPPKSILSIVSPPREIWARTMSAIFSIHPSSMTRKPL